MKNLLVFSYHFPPSNEVAGKPTARLVRRLPEQGWRATVLVPPTWAYFETDPTAYADISDYARVEPTGLWLHPAHRLALDRFRAARTAAGGGAAPVTWTGLEDRVIRARGPIRGLASRLLGPIRAGIQEITRMPDLFAGWIWPAYRHADRLVRAERYDAVLSISPSVSAHLAALLLKRRHRDLTWFAQFHDPWACNPFLRRSVPGLDRVDSWLEAAVVRACDRIVGATEEASAALAAAHGAADRCLTLHNGFDPLDFPSPAEVRRTDSRLTFTHTGSLYGHRDPRPLFESLARLVAAGRIRAEAVRVCLIGDCERAAGRSVREMARELGIDSIVEVMPLVPYPEAIARLMQSDVLLLLAQGQPRQIPAKLYEYLHVGRRILAFTDGATARVVRDTRAGEVVTSDEPDSVDAAVLTLVAKHEAGSLNRGIPTERIERYRADRLAAALARELDEAISRSERPHLDPGPVPVPDHYQGQVGSPAGS
jgi:glycosyltransferase involved in cell wall biosynthesis